MFLSRQHLISKTVVLARSHCGLGFGFILVSVSVSVFVIWWDVNGQHLCLDVHIQGLPPSDISIQSCLLNNITLNPYHSDDYSWRARRR